MGWVVSGPTTMMTWQVRGVGVGGGGWSQAHEKLHYKNEWTTRHSPPSDDRHSTCNELECHQQITIFQLNTLATAGCMPTCVALVCCTALSQLPMSDRPQF